MKILIYLVLIIGVGLIIFNTTKVNIDSPFVGDSGVACIGILAAACAVMLMIILLVSLNKQKKK